MLKWLVLLAASALSLPLAAAEERPIAGLARDGTGRLWSIGQGSSELAWLDGNSWPSQTDEALEGATPERLTRLRDGTVICLWSWADRKEAALTRQRGDAAPVVIRIAAQLREGRLIERQDGSLLITEQGPTVVEIPLKGEPRITTIPEAFFHMPAAAGAGAERTYVPIRALEDERHHVWLWAYALDPVESSCQLHNFIRYEDGAVQRHEVPGLETTAGVSDLLSADADHLWFAKVGTGIFALNLDDDTTELKTQPLPRRNVTDNVEYIEQMFRVGENCFAITSPQPTSRFQQTTEVTVQRGVVLSLRLYYSLAMPTGRLLLYYQGRWVELIAGLDRRPRFGSWERPHIMTRSGLLIASGDDGPWLVLRPEKKPGTHLGWRTNFPLKDAVHLTGEDATHFRAVSSSGETAVVSIEPPADLPVIRCREFTLVHPFLQDMHANLWAFRGNQLVRGTGEKGTLVATPDSVKALVNGANWLADDHDRGWLRTPRGAAICDFATGGWTSYASWEEALVAQLPGGVQINVPHNPFLSPVYSGDGQIACFDLADGLHYYDGHAWKTSTPKEIAGDGDAVAGSPFFNAAHRLCIPLGEHDWEWDPLDARWNRRERDKNRILVTVAEDEEPPLPEGCPMEAPTSIAQDVIGTTWLAKEGKLYKFAGSHLIQVLEENEPNPLRYGGKFSNLLVDSQGGVIFELDRNSDLAQGRHYVYIAPKFRLPKAAVELKEIKGDRARVRFSTDADASAEIWYSWKLDDSGWQTLQHRPEFLLSNLAPGAHRLQVRAYNAELGAERAPQVLDWKMPPPDAPAEGAAAPPP